MKEHRYGPVTIGLFVVIIAAFVVQVWAGGGKFWHVDLPSTKQLGAGVSFNGFPTEWWRMVTAALLHGGLLHVAMNAYALLILGATVERLFGGGWMLGIFTFTAVAGNILSGIFLASNTVGVGASGGLFGLLALAAVAAWMAPEMARLSRSEMTQWLVFGIVLGVFAGFDNWAHLGGAGAGAVLALPLVWMGKKGTRRAATRRSLRTAGVVVGVLSAGLIATSVVMAARSYLSS